MKDIKYWIWLSIFNFKPKEKIDLLKLFKNNPKNIWDSTEEKISKRLMENEENINFNRARTKNIINQIIESKNNIDIDVLENKVIKEEIEVITFLDKRYPKRLLNIYDYPIVLYIKGNTNILNEDILAIVGCRECSEYGKNIARKISMLLSEKNIVIISGMAKGIDTYAHIGCIDNNKSTIAVLGSGINVIYPKENEKLYKEILNKNGAIISEYFIDEEPKKENFPRRNRIVSGMSDGVIVVEAKKRSGSLITANLGLEQGREIYAIPRKYYK